MATELERLFIQAFPELDPTGQKQAIQLYKLLADGKAVSIKTLAEHISLSEKETHELLQSWTGVSFNEDHLINGFWGVSTDETSHSFRLGETTLYTWCAWDLLFMPVIYQQTISATTSCPITHTEISLTIYESGAIKVTPDTAMITFIKPDLAELKANVTGSFCQYIFFVDSEETGQQWQKNHDNGFLLKLDQGFTLGKNIIQKIFKDLQ